MRSPLLFEQEPTDHERFVRGLAVEQAFSVKPNAGQYYDLRVGKDQDGKDVMKRVKVIMLANTEPDSVEPPMVVFRNSNKKIKTWPLKTWLDEDTFLVDTNEA